MVIRRPSSREPRRERRGASRTASGRTRVVAAGALLLALVFTALMPASEARRRDRREPPSASELDEEMHFGAEMALEGLWREALYRWERVLVHRPDDPLLLNNVAVAREALGRTEEAREAYEAALALSGETEIATNVAYFEQARARREGRRDAEPSDDSEPPAPESSGGDR